MNLKDIKKLEELKKDDFIWEIYIFIVVFALISNSIERSSVYTKNKDEIRAYHAINLVLFIIAFLIYLYFLKLNTEHYLEKQDMSNYLSLIGTILLVVTGALFIIAELKSSNDDDITVAI